MIHIAKAKKGYIVVTIAVNREVLQTSEVLASKEKAWQNIRALLKDCFISLADYLYPGLLVQDDTVEGSKVWVITMAKKIEYPDIKKEKPYRVKRF